MNISYLYVIMFKRILSILFIFVNAYAFSQRVAEGTYWLYFTDKNQNQFSVNHPEEFLSQRSIDRRAWQNIAIDESDLPVTRKYVDSLIEMGLEVVYRSKWLNGVLVRSSDQGLINSLPELEFIDTVKWEASKSMHYIPENPGGKRFEIPYTKPPDYQYGFSSEQVSQINIQFLHGLGYTGKGVMIAVLDAGFINFPELPAFQTALENGQLVKTKNFVDKGQEVYNSHSHGTNVSSIIISNWPDTLMGTAPDASLLLGITENGASETRVEEFSWIEGAEWADSIGTDIINTSLGYTEFDDSTTNYTYEDMDGKTAHISIANSMTAAKGIISVVSAGNSGNEDWYYIGAPADAKDILSVGAVNSNDTIVDFSSRGPAYDHRIKPEISAMGYGTAVQSINGSAVRGAGTSFSSPLIAGATAALWQAYPLLTANELMRWIIESGDRIIPDVEYGYGIPNFKKAYYAITSVNLKSDNYSLKVYPNPFTSYIYIELPEELNNEYSIAVYNIQGKVVFSVERIISNRIDLPEALHSGMYILDIHCGDSRFRNRIIKF